MGDKPSTNLGAGPPDGAWQISRAQAAGAACTPDGLPSPSSSASASSLAEAHVLLLDDDPGILLLERKALERAGYRVATAASSESADESIRRRRPDLLVLDYKLNVPATGLDFYRRLRDRGLDIPAILVTGFSDEGRAIEALRLGFRDVVPKVGGYLEYLPEAVGRLLAQERAARRLAETEAQNRAKDHFFAVLSHELRTPLTPVLTAVQILKSHNQLPEDLREPIDVIQRNVELEARLIDDLLDLTRVSRGKISIQPEPTDVHEKLRNAIQIVDSDLRAKRLTLHKELLASCVIVQGDAARLQQIFWNLLKNAVKFTPEGGAITVRTSDAPENRLRLEVIDTGVGIEPDALPRIFNAFEQGSKEINRAFGGLGLGLSITRGLVELHGGTIVASSDGKDRGAVFTVEFPASQSAPAAHDGNPRPADCGAGRGLRVLLVEDNADTAKLMARLLRGYGHRVATADSVSAALQTADAERFDVVVSDIGLPDGSGFDLMQQLLRKHSIKGIALSGFGMEEDLRRSRDAGFSEHLTKPIDPRRLDRVIQQVAGHVEP